MIAPNGTPRRAPTIATYKQTPRLDETKMNFARQVERFDNKSLFATTPVFARDSSHWEKYICALYILLVVLVGIKMALPPSPVVLARFEAHARTMSGVN
jgi:hypothetical protein